MPGELKEHQIRQTSIILGLSVDFIRKDYFVTKAIGLLSEISNDYFELVFQGGTSLSKGYGVISRMSEDVDFRVIAKPPCLDLGKSAKRRELRVFRHSIIESLMRAGFEVLPQDIKVYYEGRYMSIHATFSGAQNIVYLKPHIAIDCFFGELELQPEVKNISSMVKITLGDAECDHRYFPVACVALDETAAEKWVALSRRVADSDKKPRDSDKHLVRHLYDLYQLCQQNCLSKDYYSVLERVLEKEQQMFGDESCEDIKVKSTLFLSHLRKEPKWKEHWDFFLEQMVYQSDKPSFDQAIANIEELNKRSFK